MTEHIERHSDKLLREWEQIQGTDFWKLLMAAMAKMESQAIDFTLTTHGYETILRSRGEVDGIRKVRRLPSKVIEDILAGKQG